MTKEKELVKKDDQVVPEETLKDEIIGEVVPSVVEKITAVIRRSEFYTGPTPPPKYMREYEKIVPGSANRFIVLVEDEQEHRHNIEKIIVNENFNLIRRGQNFGFVMAGGLAILGFVLVCLGFNVGAYASFIGAAAYLVSSFFGVRKRTSEQKQENEPKQTKKNDE